VEDAGSSWDVGDAGDTRVREFKDKAGRAMESVVISTGGGALQMTIDKCDARVEVSLSR
jgi:hypothetical protein